MNQRGKNNSIVFLTTLSVYLGLVLVGGALSPVLAQAATTRNFNVQDEIEIKDDLDNKPDESESESFSAKDFPVLFAQLLNEIRNEVESGKLSSHIQNNFVIESQFRLPGTYIGSSRWSSISDEKLERFLSLAINRKFVSKINKIADGNDGYNGYGKIQFVSDKDVLVLKFFFTKFNAELFAESLNQDFSSIADSVDDVLIKQIYLNSEATVENNQVFIVTRLPRGSLDALLPKDAN